MKAPTRRAVLTGVAGLAAATPLKQAFAQKYPERNITLVVPWAAGGSTDILARIVAEHLRQALGQPVIIENRTGASGNIGTATVARATPDGHTFLFNTMSVHTMNHALFASMPFDGVKDFSPIAMLAYVTNTMIVHPSVPAKTVKEFIDYARRTRERSPTPRRAPARPTICAQPCWKRWQASRWCTSPTAAARRRSPIRSVAKRNFSSQPGCRAFHTSKPGGCACWR